MGKISDAQANLVLDVIYGKIANPFPSTYYIALSSTLPTNTGTNVTEPSGGSYARASVANNTTTFPGASARSTAIDVTVSFATATADWGATLTHFALYDAVTAGNFCGWGALGTPLTIITGGIVTFPPGSLVINAPGT